MDVDQKTMIAGMAAGFKDALLNSDLRHEAAWRNALIEGVAKAVSEVANRHDLYACTSEAFSDWLNKNEYDIIDKIASTDINNRETETEPTVSLVSVNLYIEADDSSEPIFIGDLRMQHLPRIGERIDVGLAPEKYWKVETWIAYAKVTDVIHAVDKDGNISEVEVWSKAEKQ